MRAGHFLGWGTSWSHGVEAGAAFALTVTELQTLQMGGPVGRQQEEGGDPVLSHAEGLRRGRPRMLYRQHRLPSEVQTLGFKFWFCHFFSV